MPICKSLEGHQYRIEGYSPFQCLGKDAIRGHSTPAVQNETVFSETEGQRHGVAYTTNEVDSMPQRFTEKLTNEKLRNDTSYKKSQRKI